MAGEIEGGAVYTDGLADIGVSPRFGGGRSVVILEADRLLLAASSHSAPSVHQQRLCRRFSDQYDVDSKRFHLTVDAFSI